MKNIKLLLILIPAVLLAGCVKEIFLPSAEEESGLVERSYSVSMAPHTKAEIDQDALKLVWQLGDSISVYDPVARVGRLFLVSEVSEGNAVIKGSISAGDFGFSAVFPHSAVRRWNSSSSCDISFPDTQVIPAGAVSDPRALTCSVFEADSDGTIAFSASYPLVKFNVGRSDVSSVSFASSGSGAQANVSVSVPQGSVFSPGTYYAAFPAGNYTGGLTVKSSSIYDVDYTKSSSTGLVLEKGHIKPVGTVTDGKATVHYTLLSQTTIGNLSSFADEMLTNYGFSSDYKYALMLLLPIYGYSNLINVESFNFSYTSADTQGKPVKLSARLYLPQRLLNGDSVSGVVVGNHYTIAANRECPTNSNQVECMFAYKNYAVVMSDYHGFGVNSADPQAYLNGNTLARGNIDAYLAGVELIKDLGVTIKSDKVYNIGYSQGGMVSVANLKYSIEHPDCGVKFYKTFAGGGPYDFNATYDQYVRDGTWNGATAFFVMSLMSVNETEQLGLDYSKMFKQPLLGNYRSWVLSKNYSTGQLDRLIGTTVLRNVVTDGIYNQTSDEAKIMISYLKEYDLCKGGWKVPSGSYLYVFHSPSDDFVPYVNYEKLKAYLGTSSNVKFDDGSTNSHVNAFMDFILNVVQKYWDKW